MLGLTEFQWYIHRWEKWNPVVHIDHGSRPKAVRLGWKSSSNNCQDPRKSWRDAQDTEKFLDLGMSRKLRTSKRSSWKLRGLVLKVQVNNWTWDRSAKFLKFDVQIVYVLEHRGQCYSKGEGIVIPWFWPCFHLKIHDVYFVINCGVELKEKTPPSIWLCMFRQLRLLSIVYRAIWHIRVWNHVNMRIN